MGKARKWLRNFLLGGKKEKETEKMIITSNYNHQFSVNNDEIDQQQPTTPITTTATTAPTTPKEKRRWSFRRSSATAPVVVQKELDIDSENNNNNNNNDQRKHALAVAVATAVAADAAAAAAKAAAAVYQLTGGGGGGSGISVYEEAAAIKIQSAFRGYLARIALNALKGLVKLQALIRAHLVRKQATATLKCMQALITAQERARAQRIQMSQDAKINNHKQFNDGKFSSKENRFKHSNQEFDKAMEEHIKIVEMDVGENIKGNTKSRSSYSNHGHQQTQRIDPRMSTQSAFTHQENLQQQQLNDDLSPKARSGHFEEYTLYTAQSSPQQHYYSDISKPDNNNSSSVPVPYARSELGESYYTEYPFYPSYMANTQSSRAKVRSHSAPKQRPAEVFERQLSSRRTSSKPSSIEGRNVPRAVRIMQRSSSQVGSAGPQNYHHYPWSSVKLDKSNISLKDSECGSNYTLYCRSLVGLEVPRY